MSWNEDIKNFDEGNGNNPDLLFHEEEPEEKMPEFSDIKISNEKIKNLILSLIGEDRKMDYARIWGNEKDKKFHEDKIKEIEGIFLFIGFMEYDEREKENVWAMGIPDWIEEFMKINLY